MANVGTAAAGKTLIGAGNGASPTYADIGTNSGLTAFGVVVAEGTGAFQATNPGSIGQVLQSGGAAANPAYSTATYPTTSGASGNVITSNGTNFVSQAPVSVNLPDHSIALGTGVPGLSSVGPSATTGSILQSAGAAADPVFSTASYPSTATIGDLIYASGTNAYSNLAIQPLGCSLVSNGSIPLWLNPRSGFIEHEDWISATFAGNLNWGRAIVGAGTNAITNDAFLGHPGVLYLSTGTDTTGRACLITLDDCIILGDGQYQIEWLIRIEDLATVAEDYVLRVGFGDSTGAADWGYGVYFEYNRATSVNWLIKTADNSVRTSTTTSTAVTEDAWIRLTININAAATLCTYYVDGVSVGTINTNIPDGGTGADGIGPDIGIVKSAGGTSRTIYADYCTIICLLTTIR